MGRESMAAAACDWRLLPPGARGFYVLEIRRVELAAFHRASSAPAEWSRWNVSLRLGVAVNAGTSSSHQDFHEANRSERRVNCPGGSFPPNTSSPAQGATAATQHRPQPPRSSPAQPAQTAALLMVPAAQVAAAVTAATQYQPPSPPQRVAQPTQTAALLVVTAADLSRPVLAARG